MTGQLSHVPGSGRVADAVAVARLEAALRNGASTPTLIEHFQVLADASGGCRGLKDIVLSLAVRGALSARGLAESVDGFLGEVARERDKLTSIGIRVRQDLDPIFDSEIPYPVPEGWRWSRLAALGGFLGGGTPSKSNADFWIGTLPWVSPKDMKRPYIDDAEDHISTAAVAGSAVKLIPSPSLLFVVRGMILAHSFPVAVTTRDVTVNQDMKALVLAVPETAEFLLRICQAARSRVLSRVERSSHGTCRLDTSILENLPIALPPLAEQKRIVARVDQLMALIDELEAKQAKRREVSTRLTKASLDALTTAEGPEEFDTAWKRVLENWPTVIDRAEKVDKLRRTVLELATRGVLVAEKTGDETVERQLSRIRDERARLGRKPAEEPIRDSVPYDVPAHWRWVRWGDLVLDTNSGWSPQCENRPRADGEWGVLKVSAVSWLRFNGEENKALPRGTQPRIECAARLGDFLMSRANTAELVGRSVVVGNEPERLLLSDKIVRCIFSKEVDQRYINLFNRTAAARVHYVTHASGTSDSMKNISRDVILAMPVALPPLEEQKRIVAKVDHLMTFCDQLEAKLRQAEDRASKLVDAVVREMVA